MQARTGQYKAENRACIVCHRLCDRRSAFCCLDCVISPRGQAVCRCKLSRPWQIVAATVIVIRSRFAGRCAVFFWGLLGCMAWHGMCASRHGGQGMACMVCARCWAQDESKFCIPSNLFRYNEADSRAWEQSSSAVSGNRFGTSKWSTWDGVSRRNEIEEGRGAYLS